MRKLFIFIAIIAVLIIASLVIKKETHPSTNTRIILEHTYKSYVAPVCFQDADITNFLEDSTLGVAEQMDYEPHDACTEEALLAEKESLFVSLLKDIGFIQTKWDKW